MAKPFPSMPAALWHYWKMWNEPDPEQIRGHLDLAVSEDVLWADPLHSHIGRDALEANARELRTTKPEYLFVIASELDVHHDRYRYEWHMKRKHRVLMRGLDIATVNDHGLISRVDGFFGPLQEPGGDQSGIPLELRADPGAE